MNAEGGCLEIGAKHVLKSDWLHLGEYAGSHFMCARRVSTQLLQACSGPKQCYVNI